MMDITDNTPKPQSAFVLAALILALFGAEIYWIYGWHGANEDLFLANIRRSGENMLDTRKITELKGASVQITGLYLRLQDPLLSTPSTPPQLPASVGNDPRKTEPIVVQDLIKGGLVLLC